MIFAEIEDGSDYASFHAELETFFKSHFAEVMSGLQGESWIWIFEGDEKVAIDTFSSMDFHQIKSSKHGTLVQRVIEILLLRYKVNVYQTPKLEAHEES